MTTPRPRSRQPKQLDAGILQAEITSFALRLAAEGKAAKTIQTYTQAVRWFAATCLPGHASRASWEQVSSRDIQRWMAWLLDRYSTAYASNQYRALQQFFKWLAAEDELADPMTGLQPPRVIEKLVPVFTGQELTRLDHACAGRSFAQRRDTAIIAVFTATGIRLSELAGLRVQRHRPTRGSGRSQSAARAAKTGSSGSATTRPGAWTGTSAPAPATSRPGGRSCAARSHADREPLTAMHRHLPADHPPRPPVRRGRAPAPVPAPLQPHLAGPRRPRGHLMELNGCRPPRRCSAATAPAPRSSAAPAAPTTAS